MPKPPSHPRYQAVARSEPYPSSSANRSGGGGNNHGGGHGHTSSSGRGSTGRMYHPAGVTSGVPLAQQQSAAPPNFGYGPNIGIGAGSGPGAPGMMNPQYEPDFPTSTPRTIARNFGQQQSSSSLTYGQSFDSLQGANQQNSSPFSAPQHHHQPLQQPLQHQSLQHHAQHQQQQHQSPTIANQNAVHAPPIYFAPQSQSQLQPQPQQHQPPPQQHQPPPQSHHHQRASSPGHNPTTPWTPQEDSLLLTSRSSHLPWSELQRLHFPGKSANACRKRHERLVEKLQAEEEVDQDRLARIAGEYVAMREELWRGLAERMGMDVREVEEKCLGMGVGRLRVSSRQGGRRREGRRHGSFPAVGGGVGRTVSVPGLMPGLMMLGPSQGQGQGDGEEGKNYTHSPVQMVSSGPGTGHGILGIMGSGPGHGMGMGMLPPQTAPPLTTLVPITCTTTTTGHSFTCRGTLPTSSAPGGMSSSIPPPPPPPPLPPLSLTQQQQQQQQPRVAFGGYLNGRSTSTSTARRQQTGQSMKRASSIQVSTSPTTLDRDLPAGRCWGSRAGRCWDSRVE
ncbi:hypothetical protein QBC32DRAFT_396742 [Pseudoneurospora amorphoporcata]|uniref:Myb-like domain-containing protein n=1 Tax=Pseudoneurospora amorphoporcata TaxID=241081 RepID=A0AAN6SGV6_9PEZI|nr:hypothetical protein QBC32DRAFT_396742 [Pseudoneurospora amorphoporcata]